MLENVWVKLHTERSITGVTDAGDKCLQMNNHPDSWTVGSDIIAPRPSTSCEHGRH